MRKSTITIIVVVAIATIFLIVMRLSTPEDGWICNENGWVKHGKPSMPMPTTQCIIGTKGSETNTTTANQTSITTGTVSSITDLEKQYPQFKKITDELYLATPQPNEMLTSPQNVEGWLNNSWAFEGSFVISLFDGNGVELYRGPASMPDWTTPGLSGFTASLKFNSPITPTGTLRIENDNASGLPEYEKHIDIPVQFATTEQLTLKVFFANTIYDPEMLDCSHVYPVVRTVPYTLGTAKAALEQLLLGPTAEEKSAGFVTSINPNVKINSIKIENGTAYVDFDETLEHAVGGSCRTGQIISQIKTTLSQFPTITNTVISIDGVSGDTILQP
ncbi:MAG TPA: GerMN domain-containing protein [Candidatus Magasanikbacteria bacterium]|nr:GerMN domain-containing protein [Candidatus Magasanikbacteria bacterium]